MKNIKTKNRGLRATPKNIIYNNINNMNKHNLSNLSKEKLINLLLRQQAKIQILKNKYEPKPRTKVQQMVQDYEENIIPPPVEFQDRPIPKPRIISKKPVPAPRRNVKQMVQNYENNIIAPPLEFRDDYKPTPKPRTIKPVAAPRTKIEQVAIALKGYTQSFEIGIKDKKDPLKQLQNTRLALEKHIESLLASMKGLKFVETLSVTFTKPSNGETIYKNAYFNSKPQTIINNTEISGALQLTKDHILNLVAQWISE